jgi:hypothetical protein
MFHYIFIESNVFYLFLTVHSSLVRHTSLFELACGLVTALFTQTV